MRCPDFTNLVYKEMGWEKNCRYKLLGFKITVDGETIYVFDFNIPKVYREMTKKEKGEASDKSISDQTGNLELLRYIFKTCAWNPKYAHRAEGVYYPEHNLVEFDLENAWELHENRMKVSEEYIED